MSEGRSCQSCSYHAVIARECRRNAPKPVMFQGPNGQPGVLGVWPATRPENWCGEYKRAFALDPTVGEQAAGVHEREV